MWSRTINISITKTENSYRLNKVNNMETVNISEFTKTNITKTFLFDVLAERKKKILGIKKHINKKTTTF